MGLMSALSRSRLGSLGRARATAQKGFAADAAAEVPQWPVRPAREVGPGGMTVRPAEPFRQSMVGGSDDLAEAARMIRPEDWPAFMALLSAGMGISDALAMMTGGAQQNAPMGGPPGRVSY